MAVSQYIGARYVPLFYTASDNSNSWEAGVQYDPLTIVTYLNQSYTSKIPVPATVGNPADNPEYWAMTGAYNAQVNQLSQDVADLTDRVDNVETVITSGKNYIFLGDSYDRLYSPTIADQIADALGLDSDHYINLSAGSYGFVADGDHLWIDALQNAVIPNPEKYTDIIIYGGANDTPDSDASVRAAMATLDSYVRTTFPNATVSLAFIGWSREQIRKANYISRRDTYYRGAAQNGWKMLRNCEYILHNYDYLMNDSQPNWHHPTQAGATAIAEGMTEAIMSGACDVRYSENFTFTTGATFTSSFNGVVTIRNDKLYMSFGNIQADSRGVSNGTPFGGWATIGTWGSNLFDNTTVFNKEGDNAANTSKVGFSKFRLNANHNLEIAQFIDQGGEGNLYHLADNMPLQLDTMYN